MLSKIILAGGTATFCSAHVLMSTPVPFRIPALHNGPLQPDGSDFPCQSSDGVYQTGGTINKMTRGSRQALTFVGTAVHGGGSCQISITYDIAPNKNSTWKVIHSIEGGCPARGTSGNLGNDPHFKIPVDYGFPIPKDIPAGNATIAWTWLNKVGNREFYMNCAPVFLTGEGGDKSNWEALPDMLVANIGNGCTTEEGKDYKYPDPGSSVESFGTGEFAFPVGKCASARRPLASGDGFGNGSSATIAPTSNKQPGPSGNGGTAITSEAPGPTSDSPALAMPKPSDESGTSALPVPNTGGAFSTGTACSSEGQWNCIDGTSFQRCASGTWSAVMVVAVGTVCKTGSSMTLYLEALDGSWMV
ncbi:chitin-binding, domain 3 [Lasiosphaeria hispida]|uniref:Chitin-binding, domain 3 n=1 Tax=Lasiosphaeria hispida TaxID=260671 RepID=A0AAJ0HN99_9PEZI|nr:chitin-binding, domain 3 [Lasiosphaeria hispida]